MCNKLIYTFTYPLIGDPLIDEFVLLNATMFFIQFSQCGSIANNLKLQDKIPMCTLSRNHIMLLQLSRNFRNY